MLGEKENTVIERDREREREREIFRKGMTERGEGKERIEGESHRISLTKIMISI